MYWLLKTEPNEFSYGHLESSGRSTWDGVRNPVALSNMRKMRPGELAFVYHTGKEKAIVGVARVASEPYLDNTGSTVIDIEAVGRLGRPVTLAEVKSLSEFEAWELVRLPRLSVMPVPEVYWQRIIDLATQ